MDFIKQDREILEAPSDGITRVAFTSTGDFFLATSWDSTVSLYNTNSATLSNRVTLNAALLDCAVTGDDTCVVGGLDRHVSLINVVKGEVKSLGDHDDAVRCLRFYSRGNLVVSGSWDRTVRTWDLRSASHWTGTVSVGGKVYAMGLSESLNCLVLSTDRTDLVLYDLRNMSEAIERKESPLKYQTRCIEVNPDGLSYAVGSIEGRVGIQYFNPAPEVQAKTYAFKCHRKEDMGNVVVYPVNCISYNTVNGFFVTGGSDSFVNLWDGENKKRIWKLKQYPSAISSIAFSQSGKQLAIACSYMYEEGDIPNQPPVKLFIKDIMDFKDRVIWTRQVMSPKLNSYPASEKNWQNCLRVKKKKVEYSDYYLNKANSGTVALANRIIAKRASLDGRDLTGITRDFMGQDFIMKKIESLATASSIRKDRGNRTCSVKVRRK